MQFADKTIEMFMRDYCLNFKERFFGVLKVVCKGRFFERLGDAMGAAQKVVLEQTTSALGVAAVLHNVIIGQRNTNS
jgi:hypothetical protein